LCCRTHSCPIVEADGRRLDVTGLTASAGAFLTSGAPICDITALQAGRRP
jgi:hypothetical protein